MTKDAMNLPKASEDSASPPPSKDRHLWELCLLRQKQGKTSGKWRALIQVCFYTHQVNVSNWVATDKEWEQRVTYLAGI